MPYHQFDDLISQVRSRSFENSKYSTQVVAKNIQELAEINQLTNPKATQWVVRYVAAFKVNISKYLHAAGNKIAQAIEASIGIACNKLVEFINEDIKFSLPDHEVFSRALKAVFDTSLKQFNHIRTNTIVTFLKIERGFNILLPSVKN